MLVAAHCLLQSGSLGHAKLLELVDEVIQVNHHGSHKEAGRPLLSTECPQNKATVLAQDTNSKRVYTEESIRMFVVSTLHYAHIQGIGSSSCAGPDQVCQSLKPASRSQVTKQHLLR